VVLSLESGRQAAQRRRWEEALDTFTALDREEPLAPADLEILADAAWWAGQPEESVDALERAYAGYLDAHLVVEAAEVATTLAYLAVRRLAFSVASGWKAKAARLLEGVPETGAHAALAELELAEAVLGHRQLELGIEKADEVVQLARRTNHVDSEARALAIKGHALVSAGRWREGLATIDEAASTALSGSANLRSVSDVYCITIGTCRNLADFGRAAEWTDEAERFMSDHSVRGYPGVCRIHRAELKRLKGEWSQAEADVRNACDDLRRFRILDAVGPAYDEVGEIRLRMGDLAGAEDAFRQAYEAGSESQPGMALLMLARGQKEEAARGLARSLGAGAGDEQVDRLARARLLPAQVEVSLAVDDLDTALAALAELETIAADFDQPAFAAETLKARGEVALHRGDGPAARGDLERAVALWRDLGFPYETARSRVALGRAHLLTGDDDLARIDLGAARTAFDRLGAVPDLRAVDELLRTTGRPDGDRERVTRTFMFTDIVTSTDLVALIGDERWEALLAWHDRELRALFARHGGVEVSHTGDGFFVAFDRPADALEAAVAIQRQLVDHRREHGFSPSVRIGVHSAEATVEGGDFRGQGVHVAARIAAAAGAEEILVSADTVDIVDDIAFPVSDGRPFELKGIKDPVELRSVDWR
jgi:class 3 adenylate cyclase